MTDYTEQGLDKNLRPVDSPAVTNDADRVTGYEFNSNNERDAISATNIQNFSFSTGRGGTLTLGGTANGNGYLSIKNDAGSVIVTADNHGITVNDGSIVIKNAGGTTSMDASGVVSSSNFQGVSVDNSGTFSTTGTSFGSVTNSALPSLILTRTTRVMLFAFVYGWNQHWQVNPTTSDECEVRLTDINSGSHTLNNFFTGNAHTWTDGVSITFILAGQSIFRQGITSLTAGTYDYHLEFATHGSGTAEIFNYQLGYIVLGT